MCESIETGGKRCAAHTRPAFEALMESVRAENKFQRGRVRNARNNDGEPVMFAIRDYASTPQGAKDVASVIEEFEAERDTQTVMWLKTGLRTGAAKAEADKEIRKTIREARVKEKRAENLSASTLKASRGVTAETSLAGIYPHIAERWVTEKNDGITAEQVTPYINARVTFRCEKGHEFEARCNNVTNKARDGLKKFYCPECNGHKATALKAMQADLDPIVRALGNDPDAWESLPQSLRYAILAEQGLLGGAKDSFARSTALSMVHGDLTLRDIATAKDVKAIDESVNEAYTSEDDEATAIIDISADSPAFDDGTFAATDQDTRIEQVMASSGVIALVDTNPALAEQILKENTDRLWNEVYDDESKADEVLAKVRAAADGNDYRAMVADRFEADLNRVRNAPLPEGYSAAATLPSGEQVEIDPMLSQRRYALLVQDNRVVMNWSGTGAGKTLSGVLATAQVDAQETVVLCPAGIVVSQWKREYERAFPGTVVRTELPDVGEDLDATRDGQRRVWVLNYDKLSSNHKEAAERLGPLADRLDAAVLDEVHRAKATDSAEESNRRRVLQGFLDRARENNDELAVMPTTATPVVTGLDEAKSILKLAYGTAPAGMGTQPTLKNAAAAHAHLTASAVRWRPSYAPNLDRAETKIDITEALPHVLGRMERAAEDRVRAKKAEWERLPAAQRDKTPFDPDAIRKRAMSHPATMERALLPERLPAIVADVRAAKGPTVVYSEYTTGMIDPIVARLRAEGFTAEQYTGSESKTKREELIRKFQNGEIKVLVGSKPIATGVDGMQRVSTHMTVASMAWTAADDDQLVGRLYRTGQTENVRVNYLMTEVNLGKGATWSYDKGRKNRIEFRRSLADAAVDGKMPDGLLGDQTSQVSRAVTDMQKMVAARAPQSAAA